MYKYVCMLVVVSSLLLTGFVGAEEIAITGCNVEFVAGNSYYVANDFSFARSNLTDFNKYACLLVQTQDITIDGRGHVINCTDCLSAQGATGVVIQMRYGAKNVIVKNLVGSMVLIVASVAEGSSNTLFSNISYKDIRPSEGYWAFDSIITVERTTNVTIQDGYYTNLALGGGRLFGFSAYTNNLTIKNNYFENVTGNSVVSNFVSNDYVESPIIVNNTIKNCSFLIAISIPSRFARVENNYVETLATSSVYGIVGGISVQSPQSFSRTFDPDYAFINNNTIIAKSRFTIFGLRAGGDTTSSTITNNVITVNGDVGWSGLPHISYGAHLSGNSFSMLVKNNTIAVQGAQDVSSVNGGHTFGIYCTRSSTLLAYNTISVIGGKGSSNGYTGGNATGIFVRNVNSYFVSEAVVENNTLTLVQGGDGGSGKAGGNATGVDISNINYPTLYRNIFKKTTGGISGQGFTGTVQVHNYTLGSIDVSMCTSTIAPTFCYSPGSAVCNNECLEGTRCRLVADSCDAPDYLVNSNCPDGYRANGYVCRQSVGDCDFTEVCNGSSIACPADKVQNASFACRPSLGVCDITEFCDGVTGYCPENQFVNSSSICRPANYSCDFPEYCTGYGANCPYDSYSAPPQSCTTTTTTTTLATTTTATTTTSTTATTTTTTLAATSTTATTTTTLAASTSTSTTTSSSGATTTTAAQAAATSTIAASSTTAQAAASTSSIAQSATTSSTAAQAATTSSTAAQAASSTSSTASQSATTSSNTAQAATTTTAATSSTSSHTSASSTTTSAPTPAPTASSTSSKSSTTSTLGTTSSKSSSTSTAASTTSKGTTTGLQNVIATVIVTISVAVENITNVNIGELTNSFAASLGVDPKLVSLLLVPKNSSKRAMEYDIVVTIKTSVAAGTNATALSLSTQQTIALSLSNTSSPLASSLQAAGVSVISDPRVSAEVPPTPTTSSSSTSSSPSSPATTSAPIEASASRTSILSTLLCVVVLALM